MEPVVVDIGIDGTVTHKLALPERPEPRHSSRRNKQQTEPLEPDQFFHHR
jgi:hypothetical protein